MNKNLYDLIIIGAGPAGISAAIYAGRATLRTLVLDSENSGGQISITEEIVNYPGVLSISGAELTSNMRKQATAFGADIRTEAVTQVDFSQDLKKVVTPLGEYQGVAVLVATGAKPRTIGFPGEKEFTGRGVGYCATCDGEFFKGKEIFVIGGGFAAAEEAIFLTRYAKHIHMIVRQKDFTCSRSIADSVRNHPDITTYFNSEMVEIGGDTVLRHATIKNNDTGEIWKYKVEPATDTFGVFVFAGYVPVTELVASQLPLDPQGYILTDEDMMTRISGVYAAGDIRPKKLRQLATAVSDGAISATQAEKYIAATKEAQGIQVEKMEKTNSTPTAKTESFLDDNLVESLKPILERLQSSLTLRVISSPQNSDLTKELQAFSEDIHALSDKIQLSFGEDNPSQLELLPALEILTENGDSTGISFHGVPGGHEFNSFVLSLYNTAGPGQEISDHLLTRIQKLPKMTIQVGATLSCTMCPDVVQAAQLVAAHNPQIQAQMIDLSHFPDFKDTHNIMSVPAVLTTKQPLSFGRKNVEEMLTYLESSH